jgi:hypothetical protein
MLSQADTGIQEVRIWAGYREISTPAQSYRSVLLMHPSLAVFGDRHFIGRMRSVAPGEEPADWEAPFCLTKYPTTAIEATTD